MDILASPPRPSAEPDDDLVLWAQAFIAEPARTAQHARYQRYVADLLAELEAQR